MSIFKMAWRNIWRNRRRTLVTVAAMSLALCAMILYSGFAAGMLDGLEGKIVNMEVGDLQVFAKGYLDKPQIYTRMEDSAAVLDKLDRAGFPAAARLLGTGLAAAKDQSAGVQLRGIDVARDKKVSAVYQLVGQGKWLDPAAPNGAVLGTRLAKTLNVKLGDEIVVLSQAADGSMANELYRVRGVLRPVSDVADRAGVFITEGAFRELFVMPTGAHQLIVRRLEVPLAAAADQVRKLAPEHDAKSWKERMPTLASYLDGAKGMLYFMFLIVYIAIGIVILNAMLMAVFERVREFGVLKALGMGPTTVLRLVLTESAMQTCLALVIGGALSLYPAWYMSVEGINMASMAGINIHGMTWESMIYASFTQASVTGPVVTLLFIVSIAVLYPAIKAALISPVAAIQHQ